MAAVPLGAGSRKSKNAAGFACSIGTANFGSLSRGGSRCELSDRGGSLDQPEVFGLFVEKRSFMPSQPTAADNSAASKTR